MGHKRGAFPVAEQAAGRVFSLPNYPEMTDEIVLVCVGNGERACWLKVEYLPQYSMHIN